MIGSIPDISIDYAAAWLADICDEPASAERVLRQLYPDGATHASCGARIQGRRALETFWRGERTYCSGCDQKFSPTAGTILENSRLTFRQYEKLMLCLSLGCSEQRTAQVAGLHIDSVRSWISKLRILGVLGA